MGCTALRPAKQSGLHSSRIDLTRDYAGEREFLRSGM
jgi:hypothetical protein